MTHIDPLAHRNPGIADRQPSPGFWVWVWLVSIASFSFLASDSDLSPTLSLSLLLVAAGLIILRIPAFIAAWKSRLGGSQRTKTPFGLIANGLLLTAFLVLIAMNLPAARHRRSIRIVHREIRALADAAFDYRSKKGLFPVADTVTDLMNAIRAVQPEFTASEIDPWHSRYLCASSNEEFVIASIGSDGAPEVEWQRGSTVTHGADIVFYGYGHCRSFWRWWGEGTEDMTGCNRTSMPYHASDWSR